MSDMKYWKRLFTLTIGVSLLITACIPEQASVTCPIPDMTRSDEPPSVSIAVYVDGTPSMQGYVSSSTSRYAQTIEILLRVLKVESVGFDDQPRPLSETTYFRLGNHSATQKVDRISEAEYRQAALNDFYSGTSPRLPFLQVAEIDAAIVPPSTDQNKLTIIITDLYQREEDTAKIVTRIQQYIEASDQQGAVGIVGVRSEFKGTIYSESPAGSGDFFYASESNPQRPFYILFIGQIEDVHFYLDNLIEQLQFNQGIESVILSPYQMFMSVASLDKKTNDEITPEQRQQFSIPSNSIKHDRLVVNLEDPKIQPLILRSMDLINWPMQVNLEPIGHVLLPSELEVSTTPKSFNRNTQTFEADAQFPSLQQAINLDDMNLDGNIVNLTTQINSEQISPSGIYVFESDVTVKTSGMPFSEPEWWSTWSGTKSRPSGNQTTDLNLFMTDLSNRMVSLMRRQPPLVGRFCYVIQKP